MTDGNGSISWKATYTPFGGAVTSIATIENPFRFPGQYYDPETGLHYNYFRYYSPQIGRYITPDPIGLWGGVNLFLYVGANPLRWIDPLGLIWVTKRYDYHGTSNWLKWYLNRWVEQIGKGLEPTMPGADPNELVRLKRDIIQEWQRDPNNPCRDKEYPIGTIRRVTQTYTRFINPGPSEVLINDPNAEYYYQWDPWVGSPTYESFPNTRYDNLYYWRQGK